MTDGTFQVIALAIYFIAMIVIGLWANSKNNDLDDYVLGGRQLSPTVAALSAGAADMSGWLLMGLPGAVYLAGLSKSWIAIGLTIGAWVNWKFIAPRLRSYTEVAGDAVTVPVFLSNRLHDKYNILRIFAGIIILVFFTFYVSSGMVAGGKFFESSFHQDYLTGMLLVAGITMFYTFFGGFMGASYTDMVQGLLMLAALIAVPIVAITNMGGLDHVTNAVANVRPDALGLFAGTTFIGIASALAWGLGYFGQPHIIVRFMALRTPEDVPPATLRGSAVAPEEAFPEDRYPGLAEAINADPHFFDGIDLVVPTSGSSAGSPRLVGLSIEALMASAKSSIVEEIRAPICSANPSIIWPMACPIVSLIIWLRDAPSPWPRSPES